MHYVKGQDCFISIAYKRAVKGEIPPPQAKEPKNKTPRNDSVE
jgi:hypothetical protein